MVSSFDIIMYQKRKTTMQKETFGISAGKGVGTVIVSVNETVTEITSITDTNGKDLFNLFTTNKHWERIQYLMLNRVKDMMAHREPD